MVKISIIIPYYETYELTKQLLDRLVPQLTEETELILVDDGCKDLRLDEFKDKIKLIHLEENIGGAGALNEGLDIAKGKYIALIDSDDMVSEDYVEVLLKAIEEHKEDVIFFDWKDMHSGVVVHHPCNYAPWKAIYKRTIMPRFRKGWIYSYDVPFQEDLSKTNYSRVYLDNVLYIYNSNRPGNLTQKKEEARRKGESTK